MEPEFRQRVSLIIFDNLFCKYFGHGMKNCPNIQEDFRGGYYYINCWETGHTDGKCIKETKVAPYSEHFLSPEEVINCLFYN